MKYWFFLLLFVTMHSYASIYQQYDRHGNIIYSDIPINSSAKLIGFSGQTDTKSTIQEVPPEKPQLEKKETVTIKTMKVPYTSFQISSPKDQETIQNQPLIAVTFQVLPSLQDQDAIQLFMDGKRWGTPQQTTQIGMSNVDRGSHTLFAFIVDDHQRVLKQSNTITIYVHHASINSIKSTIGVPPP